MSEMPGRWYLENFEPEGQVSAMPERVCLYRDSHGRLWTCEPREGYDNIYVPEARLREAEALLKIARQLNEAYKASEEKADAQYAALRADLAALAKVLERVVLAGRYINIAPPREDDANRQSDHDEFYAANEHGEAAARAVLDRMQEGA